MGTKQLNTKNLKFVSDDGISWLENAGKAVVFATEKDFLDAVVENGQAKLEYAELMKSYADGLKTVLNILGSMENVVKYIYDDELDIADDKLEELPDISCIIFSFVDYCAVSGIHYEEITSYMLEELFGDSKITTSDLESNQWYFADDNKENRIAFITEEYSLKPEIVLYKLSAEEQEELKKDIEESEGTGVYNELYIKGCSLMLEEILELFSDK